MGADPGADLLAGARWECTATAPGTAGSPAELPGGLHWWPAAVPGTAAGALADAGFADAAERDYDGQDWWFRCRFAAPGDQRCRLSLDGLATVADVWLNGEHLLHSENMFVRQHLPVSPRAGGNELAVRCAALAPLLATRRPRPRWKTNLVSHQNLRWYRTSLLGRIPGWSVVPAPVGPWRPVTLVPAGAPVVLERLLQARCDGQDGVLEVTARLAGVDAGPAATLRAGSSSGPLELREEGGVTVAAGGLRLADVERWWPHTHGSPARYPVTLEVGGGALALGSVGFRTVEAARHDGGFQLLVNGQPIFARGACWMPPDPVRLAPGAGHRRLLLELARAANMNMVRVPGTTVYEDGELLDLCDELGLMVWHDCMLAFMDPPEEEAFAAGITEELRQVLTAMSGHPSVAVVCGSQEIEEVAAMNGLPRERWTVPLTDKAIPSLVERLLPGVAYVTSNPSGGALPFRMDDGVSQYFGVGGYLRPLEDARRAGVRFAAECLALATPPEPASVEVFGGAYLAGHDPGWKRALHHDAGRSWDMEDVRHHYQRALFGTDPLAERYRDAERGLQLGRATCAELMRSVFSEWRRHGSSCAGGLVLALNDLRLGAGWGLVDRLGRPKAPWYALRRLFAPVAVVVTDEGLNGLRAHVTNDTDRTVAGTLELTLFAHGELPVERGATPLEVPPRSVTTVDADALLEGFRDIGYAYRFAPPAHDVVLFRLAGADGETLAEEVHLPLGQARPLEADLGLQAVALPAGDGRPAGPGWTVEVRTRRFAQWVSLEVPGFRPTDSWFHLAPGSSRRLSLVPEPDLARLGDTGHPAGAPGHPDAAGAPGHPDAAARERPRGVVRALNAATTTRLVVPS